jgi:hypothetical protein
MNRLLEHYQIDVEFPGVSGAEMLEMLDIRDQLAGQEPLLTAAERGILAACDRRLLKQAAAFYAELSRFVDLAQQRQENRISPERWWWHLDVLAELPAGAVVSMMEPVAAD